jgi:hypothetical protein
MNYQLYKTDPDKSQPNAVKTVGVTPSKSFIFDPANTDYQEYLKWVSEGGVPEPADSQE